ncbi:MAG TPA: hypothetical protein VF898_13430 [Chloroflexota bacterium]
MRLAQTSSASRGAVARIFILCFIVYAYFMPRWADWNIDSRFDLTRAIVDLHTVRIDKFHWNTWDKAVYKHHYYSDKAPGTAMLGVVVYGAFDAMRNAPGIGSGIRALEQNSAWNTPIALGRESTQLAPAARGTVLGGCQRSGTAGNVQYIPWGNRLVPPMRNWALSKYVTTVGAVALLSALFVAFFYWFLGFFALSASVRVVATLLYAFATDAMPYSTVFYSHQLAAGMLFTGFALTWLRRFGVIGPWALPMAGFLFGFAFFTEYTVLLIIAVAGIYVLWTFRQRVREIATACIAGAVPVCGVFAYNWACFGNPLDTGYSHDFCWSSAQAAGYQGFTYPHIGPLTDLTVGPFRGLFYMSPYLLFALPGLALMWRFRYRAEALTCFAVAAVFILALSSYWGWNGGKVEGPRYLVPAIPFLAMPVAFSLQRSARIPAARTLFYAAAAWSIFIVWIQFLGGELFPISWLRDPVFDYSLPELTGNHIPPNAGMFLGLHGWHSLLPLSAALILMAMLPVRKRKKPVRAPIAVPVTQ